MTEKLKSRNVSISYLKIILSWFKLPPFTINIHKFPLKSFFIARVQIASCQVEISAIGRATAGTKGDKVGWGTGEFGNVNIQISKLFSEITRQSVVS